jgi:hypothetical protein
VWLYINFIVIISLTIFSTLSAVSTQDDCGIVLQMDELNLSSSGTCMLFKFSSNENTCYFYMVTYCIVN